MSITKDFLAKVGVAALLLGWTLVSNIYNGCRTFQLWKKRGNESL